MSTSQEHRLEDLMAYQIPVFKGIARHYREHGGIYDIQLSHLLAVDRFAEAVREAYERRAKAQDNDAQNI